MQQVLSVNCPKCAAERGSMCRSKNGQALQISRQHVQRQEASRVLLVDAEQAVNRDQVDAFLNGNTLYAVVGDNREERIKAVLWGIYFAREVMKVPQDQIDRNMAEIIVAAEMDLRLF